MRHPLPPDLARCFDLHQRVVQGDSAALDELAERLLPVMQRLLRRAFHFVADADISTAVEDAFLEYARAPGRMDLSRGVPLERCLMPAASRNLANLLQSERRRKVREAAYALRLPRHPLLSEPNAIATADRSRTRQQILGVAVTPAERRALVLMLRGERATAVLAQVLGLSDLSPSEQHHQVKLFKLRMVKRLRRALGYGERMRRARGPGTRLRARS